MSDVSAEKPVARRPFPEYDIFLLEFEGPTPPMDEGFLFGFEEKLYSVTKWHKAAEMPDYVSANHEDYIMYVVDAVES